MPKPCPICGGTEFSLWDTQNDIDVLVCKNCGHGHADVTETYATDIEEHYDDDYYVAMGYDRKWRFRLGRAERWLGYISEVKPPPGNMMDIGCSYGPFLVAARKLGWTAYGTDISKHALEQAEQKGFKVFWSIHPDDFPDWLPPLDVVTMTHVVEHFQDPIDYLTRLRAKMAPGGLVYIQLPNFQRLQRKGPKVPYVGPPAHAHFFTLDTARRAIEQAGWESVSLPTLRPRYIGARVWKWVPELLYQYPREALREGQTRSGVLSNMHLFAKVPE